MRPPLKWAGGKRALVKRILGLFPNNYGERRYHEPFFGGGAVFFHIEPKGGSINDINPRLMNFYRVVRDGPKELIEEASKYRYDEAEYYKLRDRFNAGGLSPVEDAAIFLYLNKTAYNGLYRVNSRGDFNVPFGTYSNPTIVHRASILKASSLMKRLLIRCGDFAYLLEEAGEGDVCYLDPPYQPSSSTANFTDYAARGFDINDQERLRDVCVELDSRGVIFVLSNSDIDAIRELYQHVEGFRLISLKTRRMISSKVSSRSTGHDLLITNNV